MLLSELYSVFCFTTIWLKSPNGVLPVLYARTPFYIKTAKDSTFMRRFIATGILTILIGIQTAFAGGILTNTNQSVPFLGNPARNAAIGIDGVYFNPAGVAFLEPGFHLGLGLQNIYQTRSVTTAFTPYAYGVNNGGHTVKKFKGEAKVPVMPSIEAAYNINNWSFQFNFGILGGGGKCIFNRGLPSFESTVAMLPLLSQNLDALTGSMGIGALGLPAVEGYDMDVFMRGRQYYYGFTLGAARKLNKHWSVYGGLKVLYGTSNYFGYVKNIQAQIGGQMYPASATFKQQAEEAKIAAGVAQAAGNEEAARKAAVSAAMLSALGQATEDVELNCDQEGWGVAPVLGVDFRTGAFNFAARYEFKTRMRLHNQAANSPSAANLDMLSRFADGKHVPEDTPAILSLGAQWSVIPQLRLNLGYNHYFDKDGHLYRNHQRELKHGTNEYTFGAEYDLSKVVELRAGGQITRYGFSDDYMEDLSFNVNSHSFGLGVGIHLSDKVKLNVSYFQTNYDSYKRNTNDYGNLSSMASGIVGQVVSSIADEPTARQAMQTTSDMLLSSGALQGSDSFTRTSRVFGLGVELKF